jgi:protein-tyrosine-phosphatase
MPLCIAHLIPRVYVILTGNILRSPMVLFSQGWSSSTVTSVFPAILALKIKILSRGTPAILDPDDLFT